MSPQRSSPPSTSASDSEAESASALEGLTYGALLASEARLQQDGPEQARLQRLLLEFNQLSWQERRPFALKIAAQILEAHGYAVEAKDERCQAVLVSGMGVRRSVPFLALKGLLADLVRPRVPADADAACVNCGARVRRDDPECWRCAASFARSGFVPRPLRRRAVTQWSARLRSLLRRRD